MQQYREALMFEDRRCRAYMHAEDILVYAARAVDRLFGAGYARANPSLVAAFMAAAATLTGQYVAGTGGRETSGGQPPADGGRSPDPVGRDAPRGEAGRGCPA